VEARTCQVRASRGYPQGRIRPADPTTVYCDEEVSSLPVVVDRAGTIVTVEIDPAVLVGKRTA